MVRRPARVDARRVAAYDAGTTVPFPFAAGQAPPEPVAGVCLIEKTSSHSGHIINVMRRTEQPQPTLGKAVRNLRHKRGVTLEKLAPEAGITLGTLSLIERGEANPTWGTVRGIAFALGVPVSELAKLAETLET